MAARDIVLVAHGFPSPVRDDCRDEPLAGRDEYRQPT
jgi:hypothetical protein